MTILKKAFHFLSFLFCQVCLFHSVLFVILSFPFYFVFLLYILSIWTVSEKIIIHDCPDKVEAVGDDTNINVFWTPPTAEFRTINGTIQLERNVSSNGTYAQPGDSFPIGSTQVEYRYDFRKYTASCIFTVNVGNYFYLYYSFKLLLGQD